MSEQHTRSLEQLVPTNNDIAFGNIGITVPPESFRVKVQEKIDNKTKPLGSLGTLEDLALKISCIQRTLHPKLERKAMFVFAADHGIAEEGVSAYPQEVTYQMVLNFLNGGAAINVLCKRNDIDMAIVDIGVKGDFESHPQLYTKKIAPGTANFAAGPAMTLQQAQSALQAGADVFKAENQKNKIDILGLGEMGIANTTSATAVISSITGVCPGQCTGCGTGIDSQGLRHKIEVLEKALAFHTSDSNDVFDVLCKVGGFEIAGMAGAALAAASAGCAVVLDGLISTAAGLIAYTLEPKVAHYFFAGHKSVEIGHVAALKHMGLDPVVDLNMRLGEGTGAAITIGLIEHACDIMNNMASFQDAGVSDGNGGA